MRNTMMDLLDTLDEPDVRGGAMIFAAHEDDRPVATGPVAAGVPTPRPALDDASLAGPTPLPGAPLDTAPPSALRLPGPGDAGVDPEWHLDRVAADVEASAAAVTWALCLALLGVTGLIVALLAVL